MYIPKSFQMDDETEVHHLLHEYSFATLVSYHEGYPIATHLPLLLSNDCKYLYGHVARGNSQWMDFEGQEVLAIFQGPHCYISPSWYETELAVPTWNYMAAHVYGKVGMIKEGEELVKSFLDMVKKYETPNSSYQLEQIDQSYLDGMQKGIVGFKIEIMKIEGKKKLSQNHPIERQKRVYEQLIQHQGENEKRIAEEMKKILKGKKLFQNKYP